MTWSAGASREVPICWMVSPSIRMSPRYWSTAVTMVPFLMSVLAIGAPSLRQLLDHVLVGVRPAVAVELPGPARVLDHVEVHLGDHQLVVVLAAGGQEVAARIHEVAGAVELADVPRRLGADPVRAAHEVAVGDRVGRLLQLPQVLA